MRKPEILMTYREQADGEGQDADESQNGGEDQQAQWPTLRHLEKTLANPRKPNSHPPICTHPSSEKARIRASDALQTQEDNLRAEQKTLTGKPRQPS